MGTAGNCGTTLAGTAWLCTGGNPIGGSPAGGSPAGGIPLGGAPDGGRPVGTEALPATGILRDWARAAAI
jgi:hypothetical protein